MIRRISKLSFGARLFSLAGIVVLGVIFIAKEPSVWLVLPMTVLLLFLLRNFITIRIEGEKLSMTNHNLFSKETSTIYLCRIKELKISSSHRTVTIPGFNYRAQAVFRDTETEIVELYAVDSKSTPIKIIASPYEQQVFKIAEILADYYKLPIFIEDKTLKPIKKGFFKGFELAERD